ncbi:hypothetical protein VNO78_22341 [Psophocarpus tetragonolobus]|uniref:Uncharacterized protein n=1 Tax=Psophocarpus tetragonolobus TaxID=3891 RepID=A0AAN9SI08_PSOTE
MTGDTTKLSSYVMESPWVVPKLQHQTQEQVCHIQNSLVFSLDSLLFGVSASTVRIEHPFAIADPPHSCTSPPTSTLQLLEL